MTAVAVIAMSALLDGLLQNQVRWVRFGQVPVMGRIIHKSFLGFVAPTHLFFSGHGIFAREFWEGDDALRACRG